ncbi:MAG: MaoC/PaaZ C-terminal domain-containing protein [Rubrivivax sp.]|jgi:acyl dehydratase|nr:MaoC/PaaZ C-terminal domain-containing protein [Rubrivivax sp.]MDP3222722.1 MaoC/PaaZ C-terminal domain-containing protein [Rubrivivax sp.]
MPKYIEDFTPGETFDGASRTITEADIVQFTGLSWDTNPVHTDAVVAAQGPFGARIAHGALTLAAVTGLSAKSGQLDGTAIAFLGIDEWRFHGPVLIGDTIRLRWVVLKAQRSASKPDRGMLSRRMEVWNQRGELVQSGIFTTMVRARPTTA